MATLEQIKEFRALSSETADRVLALSRTFNPKLNTKAILSASDSYEFVYRHLCGLQEEHVLAVFLNRRHIPLHFEMLSRGTSGYTIMDPCTLVRIAMREGASSILLAHNHPSGDPAPSQEDINVTTKIKEILGIVGCKLLDHLIITNSGSYTSMASVGIL